jgi:hypothetical protein
MSLGLTRPPLADSMMLTLTCHYTATNAKHHRYAATNLPTAAAEDAPRAAQIGAAGRRGTAAGAGVRETGYGGRTGRLAGHVRLADNLDHRNPPASDIHPRNRTPVAYVSLGTDDAIQGHRTGPGAIPVTREGKDGC